MLIIDILPNRINSKNKVSLKLRILPKTTIIPYYDAHGIRIYCLLIIPAFFKCYVSFVEKVKFFLFKISLILSQFDGHLEGEQKFVLLEQSWWFNMRKKIHNSFKS